MGSPGCADVMEGMLGLADRLRQRAETPQRCMVVITGAFRSGSGAAEPACTAPAGNPLALACSETGINTLRPMPKLHHLRNFVAVCPGTQPAQRRPQPGPDPAGTDAQRARAGSRARRGAVPAPRARGIADRGGRAIPAARAGRARGAASRQRGGRPGARRNAGPCRRRSVQRARAVAAGPRLCPVPARLAGCAPAFRRRPVSGRRAGAAPTVGWTSIWAPGPRGN